MNEKAFVKKWTRSAYFEPCPPMDHAGREFWFLVDLRGTVWERIIMEGKEDLFD